MTKIKFLTTKKIKKNLNKKIYFIRIANRDKTTKFNSNLKLGGYFPNIKLYKFIYYKIISYSKLGADFSKQFSLRSFFYLKKLLLKNIF